MFPCQEAPETPLGGSVDGAVQASAPGGRGTVLGRQLPAYRSRGGRDDLERRRSSDGAEGIQEVLVLLAGGGKDGGPDGRGLGAPGGAEAADDLTVDDRRTEVALRAIVRGLDVIAVQEDVEAVAVAAVALLEASGLSLGGDVAVEDQPIGGVLDQQPAAREGRWRDLRAHGAAGSRARRRVRSE